MMRLINKKWIGENVITNVNLIINTVYDYAFGPLLHRLIRQKKRAHARYHHTISQRSERVNTEH